MSQSPTSKFSSPSLTSCDSPFARLSGFATRLLSDLELLETGLSGSESGLNLKASYDGSASVPSHLEPLEFEKTA